MSLSIEWLVLAEAAAHDSRGALTLIGVERNVAVVSTFPAQRSYAVAASIRDDEIPVPLLLPGKTLDVEFTVVSPSGDTLLATRSAPVLGERPRPEVPGGVSVLFELSLALAEYGEYRVKCLVSVEGEERAVGAEKSVYVVERK